MAFNTVYLKQNYLLPENNMCFSLPLVWLDWSCLVWVDFPTRKMKILCVIRILRGWSRAALEWREERLKYAFRWIWEIFYVRRPFVSLNGRNCFGLSVFRASNTLILLTLWIIEFLSEIELGLCQLAKQCYSTKVLALLWYLSSIRSFIPLLFFFSF